MHPLVPQAKRPQILAIVAVMGRRERLVECLGQVQRERHLSGIASQGWRCSWSFTSLDCSRGVTHGSTRRDHGACLMGMAVPSSRSLALAALWHGRTAALLG